MLHFLFDQTGHSLTLVGDITTQKLHIGIILDACHSIVPKSKLFHRRTTRLDGKRLALSGLEKLSHQCSPAHDLIIDVPMSPFMTYKQIKVISKSARSEALASGLGQPLNKLLIFIQINPNKSHF
jgi:hypothetical protein